MKCLYCSLLSALPAIEVRGSIPCLAAFKCDPSYIVLSYLIATIVGILVYIFIEEILKVAEKFFEKFWKGGARLLEKIIERTEKGAGEKVRKYGTLGLALFVAIPLPGTGVWSGALAAYLLGLDLRDTVIALSVGNAIATAIMSLSYVIH